MAVVFTGFIIALKFNYCHGVSTEPGFRNCSDARNFILKFITCARYIMRDYTAMQNCFDITCLKSKYRDYTVCYGGIQL